MSGWRRPTRRWAHRVLSRLRGGRGVPVRAAKGWTVAVAPDGYEDLRYWLEYERATFALIRRVWTPGMAVLDVGAHHGLFSCCCCKPRALPSRVVAVEPSPEALPLLRANRAVHPDVPWTVVEAAAGAAEGRLTLYTGFIHMLVADPALHAREGQSAAGAAMEVRVATLDAICAETDLRPDLVKIDVEAYEAEALRGAAALLRQHPLIVLEWHCAMLRQRGLDPFAALRPLTDAGYTFEPYEFPALGTVTGGELRRLPERDIYRLLCRT